MAGEVDVEKGKLEINELLQDGNSSGIDEKKVQTAVKFLQNPKVRQTSFEKRLSFLRNKGLTEKEIEVAIKRSGTEQDKDVSYESEPSSSTMTTQRAGNNMPIIQAQPTQTTSGRFMTYLTSVVIGGGLVYSAGFIIQTYVLPYLYGKEQNDTKNLEKSIKELSDAVVQLNVEMKDTLKHLEDQLEKQMSLIAIVNHELAVTKERAGLVSSDGTRLSDVKTEIASVKGLLLGRRQFPASPFTAASTAPSIPAWQKVSTEKKTEDKTIQNVKKKVEGKEESEISPSPKEEAKIAEDTTPNLSVSTENVANDSANHSYDEDDNASFVKGYDDSEILGDTSGDETANFDESFEQEIAEIDNSNSSTFVKIDADS